MNRIGKKSHYLTTGIYRKLSVGQESPQYVSIGGANIATIDSLWQHRRTSPIDDLGLEGNGYSNREESVLVWVRPDPRRLQIGDGVVFGPRGELVTSLGGS